MEKQRLRSIAGDWSFRAILICRIHTFPRSVMTFRRRQFQKLCERSRWRDDVSQAQSRCSDNMIGSSSMGRRQMLSKASGRILQRYGDGDGGDGCWGF
ncbi:hypothetical protein TIFTF001_023702 [Ficus carica]|uniref:Uncharacterized protein n=1 Tax=Ficus carica TaxID=3494 RepID=A0AA88AX69_FICCA|nr:hypothetical protein TIFTF001_023702 [Ficus carica]